MTLFQRQENAFLDVGIQRRFTDCRVELDPLGFDFAQDGRRRIAVIDDPAFNVFRQASVGPDFKIRPLRRQVRPVCRFGYFRAIPVFSGQVGIKVFILAALHFVVDCVSVDADVVGDLLNGIPVFQTGFDFQTVVP